MRAFLFAVLFCVPCFGFEANPSPFGDDWAFSSLSEAAARISLASNCAEVDCDYDLQTDASDCIEVENIWITCNPCCNEAITMTFEFNNWCNIGYPEVRLWFEQASGNDGWTELNGSPAPWVPVGPYDSPSITVDVEGVCGDVVTLWPKTKRNSSDTTFSDLDSTAWRRCNNLPCETAPLSFFDLGEGSHLVSIDGRETVLEITYAKDEPCVELWTLHEDDGVPSTGDDVEITSSSIAPDPTPNCCNDPVTYSVTFSNTESTSRQVGFGSGGALINGTSVPLAAFTTKTFTFDLVGKCGETVTVHPMYQTRESGNLVWVQPDEVYAERECSTIECEE